MLILGVDKKCGKCRKVKKIEDFNIDNQTKSKRNCYCRECKKIEWSTKHLPPQKKNCLVCKKEFQPIKKNKRFCSKYLRPLWAFDNLSKHDKIDKHFQPSLLLEAV